jgi:hypothetical protein
MDGAPTALVDAVHQGQRRRRPHDGVQALPRSPRDPPSAIKSQAGNEVVAQGSGA